MIDVIKEDQDLEWIELYPKSMKYLHEGVPIEYDNYIRERNMSE